MKEYCPYRICPLGAHIDHQNGIVVGGAINYGVTLYYKKNKSNEIIIKSNNYNEVIIFNIGNTLFRKYDWGDYFRGIIVHLKEKYSLEYGLTGSFKGDLPSGGISTSSACQITFVKALCKINHIYLTTDEILEIVYSNETKFMKLLIGKLDAYSEILSKKNSLIFLDTLTDYCLTIKNKSFIKNYQFLIIFNGIERNLINSKYNLRVQECKSAYKKMNININNPSYGLRDIPHYLYEKNKELLNSTEIKRMEHYYSEIQRVKNGLVYWKNNNMKKFGSLMFESCESSIKNYESGSAHLNDLYYISKSINKVLGMRFLGAGFNGSSLILVKKNDVRAVSKEIKKQFLSKYPNLKDKFKIYRTYLCDGAKT